MNYNKEIYILIIIAGLLLPFVLIPVSGIILEEVVKGLVVFLLILKLKNKKEILKWVFIFGFLFGITEAILYLNNILQINNLNIFWQRLIFTLPMHIITTLIITFSYYFIKIKFIGIIVGMTFAIFIHYFFNNCVELLQGVY